MAKANTDLLMLQAQSQSAKNQMAFQERMSNTAHQREVADLKAAGLNPVLSAGGAGASTPQGAEGDLSGLDIGKVISSVSSSGSRTAKSLAKTVDTLGKTVGQTTDKLADVVGEVTNKFDKVVRSASDQSVSSVISDLTDGFGKYNSAGSNFSERTGFNPILDSGLYDKLYDIASSAKGQIRLGKLGSIGTSDVLKALFALSESGAVRSRNAFRFFTNAGKTAYRWFVDRSDRISNIAPNEY